MATTWLMKVRQPLHILAMMEVGCSAMDAVHTPVCTAPVGIGDGSSRQYVCTAAYVAFVIVSLAC